MEMRSGLIILILRINPTSALLLLLLLQRLLLLRSEDTEGPVRFLDPLREVDGGVLQCFVS